MRRSVARVTNFWEHSCRRFAGLGVESKGSCVLLPFGKFLHFLRSLDAEWCKIFDKLTRLVMKIGCSFSGLIIFNKPVSHKKAVPDPT